MQVKLVRHTPEPEKTVAMSARLCYSPIGAAQLEEKISDEQAAALVRKLVSMGHFPRWNMLPLPLPLKAFRAF